MSSALRFVGGLLVAGVLVEAFFHVVLVTPLWRILPIVEPILGQPDADLGYRLTPGAWGVWPHEHRSIVHINSLGLRDDEMTAAKPSGVVRVALTGNSIVEAFQVPHGATFEALTEAQLAERGQRVEIANLAMSGNGPVRQLARLERDGMALDPDMVVMFVDYGAFSEETLLNDSATPGYSVEATGGLRRGYGFRNRFAVRNAETSLGKAFVAAYQDSELFRLLYLRSRMELAQMLGLAGVTTAPTAKAPLISCSSQEFESLLRLWRDHTPPLVWQAAERFSADTAALVASKQVPVILAVELPLSPSTCPNTAASRALLVSAMHEAFAAHGLGFVDWNTEVLRQVGPRRESPEAVLADLAGFGVQRGGGHLNFDGHRVYAAVLTDVLAEAIGGLSRH